MSMMGSYMNELRWMFSGVINATRSKTARDAVSAGNLARNSFTSAPVWFDVMASVTAASLIFCTMKCSALSLEAIDKTILFSKLMPSAAFRQLSASA